VTLNNAVQLEIWCYVWRENYAQTIVKFADSELTSDVIGNAIQPTPDLFESHHENIERLSNRSSSVNNLSSSNRMSFSINDVQSFNKSLNGNYILHQTNCIQIIASIL
jgi:hypothetical protein